MLTMYSEGIYACFADIIKKDPPQSAKTSYQNKQTDGNEGGRKKGPPLNNVMCKPALYFHTYPHILSKNC